jgi:hypothetical protein
MSKPEFVYVTYIETSAAISLKSLLESGTALAIPTSALGIEGL